MTGGTKRAISFAPSARLSDSSFGLSTSTFVKTRKAVIYTCVGLSQRKLWWKFVSLLTCKSFVKHGYRGVRLIEQLSSWFLPKFPSVRGMKKWFRMFIRYN